MRRVLSTPAATSSSTSAPPTPGSSSGTASAAAADYSTEPELLREEVHLLWSEPSSATPEQVGRLAAEVLRWRDFLETDDPDLLAALGADPSTLPGVSPHWLPRKREED